MNVLYVDHSREISGAERALLDLIANLPGDIEPTAICPPGALQRALEDRQVRVRPLPAIDASFGASPLRTAAGALAIGRAGLAIRRTAREVGARLVHANTTRAALAGLVASRLGAPPTIVHLHDCLPQNRRGDHIRRALLRGSAAILANSCYTARQLDPDNHKIRVVYNSVDIDRFDPARGRGSDVRARLGIPRDASVLAVVGQLTPWKAQDDAIRILERVRRGFPETILLVIGSPKFLGRTRFDNQAYVTGLHRLARDLDVAPAIRFLGERDDMPELLGAVDVLLAPSWAEPFGIAVIEAMAMEIAVVATAVGGPAEIISDHQTGLLRPPHQIEPWVDAVAELLGDSALRRRIGAAARMRVRHSFNRRRYVAAIVGAYRETLQ